MMYWMAMSGSNEPVCGSAVSLAEPPTMPTMRSPPLFGVPAADAELVADGSSSPPQADASGPRAESAPMAAAPFSTWRRVTRVPLMKRVMSPTSYPDLSFCSATMPSPIPVPTLQAGHGRAPSSDGRSPVSRRHVNLR